MLPEKNEPLTPSLRVVQVTPDYPYMEKLLDIRDEAFPANERLASRDASLYNEENGYVIVALEENSLPVGFMLLYHCGEDACYGFYLAIEKESRNKHYGGRLLQMIVNDYLKGKMFFGCIEAVLPEAENYRQRLDRARFYQRNGLFILDGIVDAGLMGKYQFVCSDSTATYEQLMEKMKIIRSLFVR